ncbi:TetR/AcrR family transcriptional regulator [Blastococcus sp. CT_GayMR20]|uniref:TetR/AcrR family transcriptional regulator n=1 Tax=Blastococcus sp. CT_GayMR20 TaxID=2559609 RepID=UPI00142FDAEE|nr:TetR/AcrR family transcriptional regulator [Blastococcus sp. CT_GayMR20]
MTNDAPAQSSVPTSRRTRCSAYPLDPAKDEAIRAAVVQVLAEVGYSRLTMDEVAMTAGVGKAAIYRRWSSKADLLVSYIDMESVAGLVLADTGWLRDDLVILLTSIADLLAGPVGRANRALIGILHENPALFDAYRHGPLDRWSAAFTEVFRRAVERGDITPDAATSVAAEAGPGIIIQRWLITGAALDEELVRAVVEQVMIPLLRGATRPPSP